MLDGAVSEFEKIDRVLPADRLSRVMNLLLDNGDPRRP